MRIISVATTAETLDVSEKSVRDARWRKRVGLPLVRIGRRVGVLEKDLLTLIERGKENLVSERPVETR